MLLTPPSQYLTTPLIAGGSDCISNKDMSGTCLAIMILFSVFVQAAEGLHYGVVPYVSRPALGVVSGMVGAGGLMSWGLYLMAPFFRSMPPMSGK